MPSLRSFATWRAMSSLVFLAMMPPLFGFVPARSYRGPPPARKATVRLV
jgi:hypothetical protein